MSAQRPPPPQLQHCADVIRACLHLRPSRLWHDAGPPVPTCALLPLINLAANRIGAEGDGFRFAMAGLDGGRINIA